MLVAMLMVLSIVPAQAFAVETRAEKLAGSGTADDPYQIATAQQFDSIRNDLTAHYILTQDIDLSSVADFQPIGSVTFADADEDGNMKAEKAFTGTLDGNGKTISNVTVKDNGNLIGVGIFGVTMNQASITDLTLCNVTSTGSKALATGGLVGYGMSQGGVKNIKLTASHGKTNTITGTNCVGGIVGGSGSPIVDCYAEQTTINLFGDNTTGDNNFSEGRLVQHDVAECGAAIVGGGFGTTVTGCTAKNCTINANDASGAKEGVGMGGIGGSMQCMTEIKNNHVENLTINAPGGHAIGGLCGYTGNGNMPEAFGTEATVVENCSVKNLKINAKNATHVGGLIGTNMYYMGMEGQFVVASNCSVSGSITAGTDSSSIYGASTPGAVAGRAAGCTIADNACDVSGLTINGKQAAQTIGVTNCMYESADQDDDKDQTNAGAQLNALFDTYQQLFQGATFESKCDQYWHDGAAAVVGADMADQAAAIMKASIGGTVHGQEAVDKYEKDPDATAFDCRFTQNIANLTFNGTEITGTDASGKQVFRHAYKCIGNYNIGEEVGREDFGGFVMQSLDGNEDEFKYFLILPDTPDSTYHIEFRYGSDLDALQKYSSGPYAYWMAAGIPTSAMHETSDDIGKNDAMLRNVIALFCTENLSQMANDQTAAQRADLVGTWDASDETIAALRQETGKSKATMYMQLNADGFGATYVDLEGDGKYFKAKNYTFYAYDNDGSDSKQSGVYLAAMDTTTSSSPYTLTTKNDKTVLSLYAADGTASWTKRREPFTDVPRDAYYADAVRWASNQGVTGGTSPTTFSPNDACTRAQVVTFLWNANGRPQATRHPAFTDVPRSAYYYDAVCWAAENGITAGTSKTTFSPNAACTRAQVVTFLYNESGRPEAEGDNPFADVTSSDYYYAPVVWAHDMGITGGTSKTTFSPNDTCTRAQVVTFLYHENG